MKKVKIELKHNPVTGFYRVVKMINAAIVTPRSGTPAMIGSDIDPRHVDEFARNRRWDVTIVGGA